MEELGQRQRERQRPRQTSYSDKPPSTSTYPDDVFEPVKISSF